MKKKSRILYNLTSFKNLKYLFICIIFFYFFFHIDGLIDREFIDSSIGAKNRMWRTFLFFLANNKYGYWVIKSLTLIAGLFFAYIFVDEIRQDKEEIKIKKNDK